MFGFKTFTGCIAKNNMGSNVTFQSKWDQKYLNTPSSYTPLPSPQKNDAQLEITSYLDTSFSYWNSLLFHGFMDSNLIFRIHFVKFINAANTLQTNKKKMKTPSSLSHLAGIHITNKILQILCFLATDSNYS